MQEPFPFKSPFINPEELWTNAVSLDTAQVKVLEYPAINDKRPRPWQSIPRWLRWEFQRAFVAIVVSDEAYDKVDKLVDYFSEGSRMCARRKNKPSPLEFYQQNYDQIVRQAQEMQSASTRPMPLQYWMREAVYIQGSECSTFKISVTKALFKYFGSKVVLDPSAGWGDRVLGGAAADVIVYHGIDPNPDLRQSYDNILNFIRAHGRGQQYAIITDDFLLVDIQPESYDTVFTSPPFWDYEDYSSDPNQSIAGRPTLESWITEFFLPYLTKAWQALIPGGYFLIYISDTRDGKYVQRMHTYINNTLNGNFLGVIAMANQNLNHGYPIWCWRK